MNELIKNHDLWLLEYKQNKYNVWFTIDLSNGEKIYLRHYDEWYGKLKQYCYHNNLKIECINLQYRSNIISIDTRNSNAVYLIRSVLGQIGQANKQTVTIGKLINNTMKKSIFLTPELITYLEEEDPIESCFEEAIIYHDKAAII
jgi:hypothetical protein